jgi:hypothetical protein
MQPRLKVQIGDDFWINVLEYGAVEFDEQGFWARGNQSSMISWEEIIRVAEGYRIHPYAIADWDFWAFQTHDPSFTVWVYSEVNPSFGREIKKLFGDVDSLPRVEWADREFNVRALVFWPRNEYGQPLYKTVKRRWWSWRSAIAYYKTQALPE